METIGTARHANWNVLTKHGTPVVGAYICAAGNADAVRTTRTAAPRASAQAA